MSLYYRLKRRLGYDTTTEIVHEEPIYEYTVTHLNGEETVDYGNWHKREEGFLFILRKDDDTWAKATFDLHMEYTGPPGLVRTREGFNTVRELEGVQEVEKERIGTERWIFTVDKADRQVVDRVKEQEYNNNKNMTQNQKVELPESLVEQAVSMKEKYDFDSISESIEYMATYGEYDAELVDDE